MKITTVLLATLISLIVINLLRSVTNRYETWIILGVSVIIFSFVLVQLTDIFDFVKHLQGYLPQNLEYLPLLGKVIGIGLLGEFVSSLCVDSGMKSIASNVDIACKCSILVLAIPLLKDVLEMIKELML